MSFDKYQWLNILSVICLFKLNLNKLNFKLKLTFLKINLRERKGEKERGMGREGWGERDH